MTDIIRKTAVFIRANADISGKAVMPLTHLRI